MRDFWSDYNTAMKIVNNENRLFIYKCSENG